MIDYKLHIPGPVNIAPETYQSMSTPVMGHRSQDFVALYQSCQPNLQKLFQTEDPVFLSTSSAWGAMEGSVRNLTNKKVLCCMCGAFSDKWRTFPDGAENRPRACKWNGEKTSTRMISVSNFRRGNSTSSLSFTTKLHAE